MNNDLISIYNFPLKDINECSNTEDNNCDENAICTNTNGSFTCQCETGYTGNGTTCNGKSFCDSIVSEIINFH